MFHYTCTLKCKFVGKIFQEIYKNWSTTNINDFTVFHLRVTNDNERPETDSINVYALTYNRWQCGLLNLCQLILNIEKMNTYKSISPRNTICLVLFLTLTYWVKTKIEFFFRFRTFAYIASQNTVMFVKVASLRYWFLCTWKSMNVLVFVYFTNPQWNHACDCSHTRTCLLSYT